ncbi:MAG TPA: hypothetical protein VFU16_08645 [Solirubrobacterales bacterium]|nr:hypothetical protein [Solirubrobacterales bacterium]
MVRITLQIGILACAVIALGAGSALAMPPSIVGEGVSGVTETDAVLEASIIPGHFDPWEWEEAGGAYYQFQIAEDPSEFWPEVTCPEDNPKSPVNGCLGPYGIMDGPPPAASIERKPGDLPTLRLMGSIQPQQVALELASAGVQLEPATTYHYRVIAVELVQTIDSPPPWYTPPLYGDTQIFTTPPYEQVFDPPSALVPPISSGPAPRVSRRHRGSRCQRARAQGRPLIAVGCRRPAR